jgi:hypothetical protein
MKPLNLYHSNSDKILFIFLFGGFYYSRMTINQKINFKNDSLNFNLQTLGVSLRYRNNELTSKFF